MQIETEFHKFSTLIKIDFDKKGLTQDNLKEIKDLVEMHLK